MTSTKKIMDHIKTPLSEDALSPLSSADISSTSADSPEPDLMKIKPSKKIKTREHSFIHNEAIDISEDIGDRIRSTKRMRAIALFDEILDKTLAEATAKEKKEIKLTQLCDIMRENFGEILKNSVDSYMKLSDSDKERGDRNKLCLSMRIDINKKTITMVIQDNGQGFPPTFLSKVDSPDSKIRYVDEKSSSEKVGSKTAIGGRGLGLRGLISNVETGHDLAGSTTEIDRESREEVSKAIFLYHYEKPSISEIIFDNVTNESGTPVGASITVTMTRQPLRISESAGNTVLSEDDDFKLDEVPTLGLNFGLFK